MATAQQILELMKSYAEGDKTRFQTIALQVAAHEAKLGHVKVAEELRLLVNRIQKLANTARSATSVINLIEPRGELANLLAASYVQNSLKDLSISPEVHAQLEQIIVEQKNMHVLERYNLSPHRKILMYGPPGTGKTLTASALAGELKVPLFTIRLDGLITRYLGETAAKLRLVFDTIKSSRAVYFFDEFDAIGSDRALSNDVGEMRRILNSFLQFLEQDQSTSLIMAATNHSKLLDPALFRRFDEVIHYSLPESEQIKELIKSTLSHFSFKEVEWQMIIETARGLSHAEIVKACKNAAKKSVISPDDKPLNTQLIIKSLSERHAAQLS